MLEEIEELLMANKILSKEKDEHKSAVMERNRENLTLKRNIEEVIFSTKK